MGNKNFYGKEAIASNVIPEDILDASQKKKEGPDHFGRKGPIPEPDMTKTFIKAKNFLKKYGDGEPGFEGDVAKGRHYLAIVPNEDSDSESDDLIIVTTRGHRCFNCINGKEVDSESIQCILGNLEEFFEENERGYVYSKGRSAIFVNEEKLEALQELVKVL